MSTISPDELMELCRLIKQGNKDALRRLFLTMQPKIFSYLLRYTGIREVAEDLTQETFINFWLSKDKIISEQTCIAYLYKIARNQALNHVSRTVRTLPIDDENPNSHWEKMGNNEIPEVFIFDDYQKALNTLPTRCRETFLLSRFSGLKYSEIAEIMGVSQQTVKNQMNKAISILRLRLSQYLK